MSEIDLQEIGRARLQEAEERTLAECDSCVVKGSLRNVSAEERARHAAFWAEQERRRAMKDRRPARVVSWRRNG